MSSPAPLQYAHQNHSRFREELKELLRIPSLDERLSLDNVYQGIDLTIRFWQPVGEAS